MPYSMYVGTVHVAKCGIHRLVRMSIMEAGYEVDEAEDGSSAMHMLRACPPYDLLVTDVGLPGALNGRQVADAAMLHQPQT